MNTPTFKEQFDKITEQYFNGKLKPYDNCACFVGNLLNGDDTWSYMRWRPVGKIMTPLRDCINRLDPVFGFYTMVEICELETNFMNIAWKSNSEDDLFHAMDSTLDMLRKIHESKGEVIEDYNFSKRQLA